MATAGNGEAAAPQSPNEVRFAGIEDHSSITVPLPRQQFRRNAASVRQSLTIRDVLGNNVSTTQGPTEHEMVTKILKSVENIDLNEGEPLLDEETTRLLADIVRDDVAARASAANSAGDQIEEVNNKDDGAKKNPELVPLTTAVDASFLSAETAKSKDKKKRTHRKTQSVEQRLFGLTEALGQLDTRTSSARDSSKEHFLQDSSDRLTKTANVLSGHAENQVNDDIEANRRGDSITSGSGDDEGGKKVEDGGCLPVSPVGRFANYVGFKMPGEMEDRWDVFKEFLESREASRKRFAKQVALLIMLPSLGMAFLFYYALGNPQTGDKETTASYSWWFLFLGMRQPVAYSMAMATQSLVIDYVVLRTRTLLKWLGPFTTLIFVQARGWPFIATFWGFYSLILNSGKSRFANHWLFWQNFIGLFNSDNPSGNVPQSYTNMLLITLFIIVGMSVSLKRVLVSLVLGKQAFEHFGEELANIMKSMVLIGSIATLARTIEKEHNANPEDPSSMLNSGGRGGRKLQDLVAEEADADAEEQPSILDTNAVDAARKFIANHTTVRSLDEEQKAEENSGAFTHSVQAQLKDLLGSWEEPQGAKAKTNKKITIGSVLQFRQSLTLMNAKYPFSPAFGIADTREACIDAAQEVYERLMLLTPDLEDLPFETLALVATEEGNFDDERAKEMIKLFRPDRNGKLTKLDFVKSIDDVYKSIRLLTANISNTRRTDAAVESIINGIFWFIIVTFVLSEIGLDPWAILVSLSTLFITFSFMFGNTASKYFDGMLFILLQRPYGVGDRIHFSSPDTDTSIDGSSGWIVEELSLHTTTVYWGATNERATISNGAISNYRVINSARSPNATIYVNLKFAVDTPYEKIETFKAATEQFLKDRPREWLAFVGFRPTEVAVDRGYINYVTIAQHRSSWQNIGAILTSKAGLVKFLMEVAKQLDMRYSSPPLPVELAIQGGDASAGELTPANIAQVMAGS